MSRKKSKKLKKIMASRFDQNGSYTGIDEYDQYATPVQDVDDL